MKKETIIDILNWAGIVESIIFAILIICRIWIGNNSIVGNLMLTDLILFLLTGFLYASFTYKPKQNK